MKYILLGLFLCASSFCSDLEQWQIDTMRRDHLSVPPILIKSKPILIEIKQPDPVVLAEVVEMEDCPPTKDQLELMRRDGLMVPPKINGEFPNIRKKSAVAHERSSIVESSRKGVIERAEGFRSFSDYEIEAVSGLTPKKVDSKSDHVETAHKFSIPVNDQVYYAPAQSFCPECYAKSHPAGHAGRGPMH